MEQLSLTWMKCVPDAWCSLKNLDLDSVGKDTYGVYIIWYAAPSDSGRNSAVVRVGQGNIRARLQAHRDDKKITQHSRLGQLMVTWALPQLEYCDGVERHLAEVWEPLVGDRFPDVETIEVNSPFE